MPVLDAWSLALTVDDILRAQGANPDQVRQRSPALLGVAEWARQECLPLLEPKVLYKEFVTHSITHERLYLESGIPQDKHPFISGKLVAEHLRGAQKVTAILCTIGSWLEETASALAKDDMLSGLALDAAGSAATELLATQASHHFESIAAAGGLQSSMPLNPGMVGWPVPQGQSQVFSLLVPEMEAQSNFKVRLDDNYLMHPRKTISLVLGMGTDMGAAGRICDYCTMNESCRYQNHYAG